MNSWHPLFAALLRPWVEGYYEVVTNVAVGDLPREADIVLVRRSSSSPPPFQGIWKNLTRWNVIEFKGPSVTPRRRDLDLLVEVGLGIDRRLNRDLVKKKQTPLPPQDVSFWYLANRLGKRYLTLAENRLGPLQVLGPGVWRCTILLRPVFLVSRADLAVEPDSVSLHMVAKEPRPTMVEVGKLVIDHPVLLEHFAEFFAGFQPSVWKEVLNMARTKDKGPQISWDTILDYSDIDREIPKLLRLIKQKKKGSLKTYLEGVSVDDLLANWPPKMINELKKRLQ